jgi:hypothetical protein
MNVVSFSCGIIHSKKLALVIAAKIITVIAIPFFDAIFSSYHNLVYI